MYVCTMNSEHSPGTIHFMFGGGAVWCLPIWRIFPSNKSVSANREKGFYTSRLPKNEEILSIFYLYLAAQNFKLFSKILNQNKAVKGSW
jgi:hypothetical protein